MQSKECSHGCGHVAGNDGYCDRCYDDSCLAPPDGVFCRYTIPMGEDTTTTTVEAAEAFENRRGWAEAFRNGD